MKHSESLSDLVLKSLEAALDGYLRFEDFVENTHIYARGYQRNLKKNSLQQALYRLRKEGLIEKKQDPKSDEVYYKLSNLGEEYLMLHKKEEELEWDGMWRLVIFDIPEDKRRVRDLFRNKLKGWGFIPWQQSVWVSKKNVTARLRSLVKDLGIGQWVMVIETDDIGIEK